MEQFRKQRSRPWSARGTIAIRALISTCAMVSMASALSACATVEPTVAPQPGETFSLPVGKTAAVDGAHLTFKQVTTDSRCPVDVQCVWAGEAKIEVTISRTGSPDETKILSLTPPNDEVTSGDLRIRLVSLAPAPRQAEPPASRAYVVQLVFNRT